MKYKKYVYKGEIHLIDDTLEKNISNIRTKIGTFGMLYVVLDACHPEESSRGDEEESIRGTNEGLSPFGKIYTPQRESATNDYFKISTIKGQSPVMFIEACRLYQQNKEIRDTQTNTWVWYAFLLHMSNNEDPQKGKI